MIMIMMDDEMGGDEKGGEWRKKEGNWNNKQELKERKRKEVYDLIYMHVL